MRCIGRAFLIGWAVLGLTGCMDDGRTASTSASQVLSSPVQSQRPKYQPIAFLKPPIKLSTRRVDVIRKLVDFSGVQREDFVTSPERVVRLWAQQRLRAEGGDDRVAVIIEKLGMRRDPLDQGERITVVMQVRVEIDPADARPPASSAVKVESETTIDGPISPDERRAVYHRISQDIANKLDERLSQSVQTKLAGYLKPDPVEVAARDAPSPAKPQSPARARVTAPPPVVSDSPLADSDGRLPPSAWRRGWNWKKTP